MLRSTCLSCTDLEYVTVKCHLTASALISSALIFSINGTLKVFELQITGPHPPDWREHEDIWKELFTEEETKR